MIVKIMMLLLSYEHTNNEDHNDDSTCSYVITILLLFVSSSLLPKKGLKWSDQSWFLDQTWSWKPTFFWLIIRPMAMVPQVLCSLNLSGNLVDEKSASAWKITLCSLAGGGTRGNPWGTLGEPGELREAAQMVVIYNGEMTRKSWSQLSEKSCFKPFLVHVMSS